MLRICTTLNKESTLLHSEMSADEDDKDDEYDGNTSSDFNAQNLRRIKQRKSIASFRHRVPMRTIRMMNTQQGFL